ncbi:hypothetical protein [Streptomyces vilmorinianum]|uniref:hypothetical protein n=1 Tax=Streptomyces vilmorinianum TaxID=3051092 RepID=UPI0010FBB272|nr:hypothetical protein [Streptomyces vilmorinianum]
MSMEKAQPRPPEPEGCLTAFIRIPVRIVVLVVVVPVRMVWDVLVVCARAVERALLRPLGRALAWIGTQLLAPLFRGVATVALWLGKALFVWPWVALWRYVLVPVGRYGVAIPSVWLYREVLTPLGQGLVWLLRRVGVALFVWPWVALWRYVLVPVGRYGVAIPSVWLYREVLTPLGQGLVWLLRRVGMALFVWPWVALWRYVLVPVARYGIGGPVVWAYRWVLAPLGRGLDFLAVGLWRYGIAIPSVWLYRAVLTPLGHALVQLGRALFVWPWVGLWRYVVVPVVRYGIVAPLVWLYRRVLVPLGREIADAFRVCWRIAGYISRAAGRALKWVAWNLAGRPVRWFYRSVCTPVGHWVRDQVWAPAKRAAVEAGRAARAALASARETVRRARQDAWHALVGGPRVTEPGEPVVASTRTLGSTTTASGAAPAPEISLRKRG